MRAIQGLLGHPGLHIVAALGLAIYACRDAARPAVADVSSKLLECRRCRWHYYPEKPCDCRDRTPPTVPGP